MIETEVKVIDFGQQSVVKNSNTIAAERRRRHLQYLQEKNEVARKEHIQQMKLSRAQWQFATDRAHILSCSQRIQVKVEDYHNSDAYLYHLGYCF